MQRKRKPDIPPSCRQVLSKLIARRKDHPNAPWSETRRWLEEIEGDYGKRTVALANDFFQALTPTELHLHLHEKTDMKTNNVNNTGVMTGVAIDSVQIFRDLTIYGQQISQANALTVEQKDALLAARQDLENASIPGDEKAIALEQFEKMSKELEKGDAANTGIARTCWKMLKAVVAEAPAVSKTISNLGSLFGF